MPKQTIVDPSRELRFRRTTLLEAVAEVWMPVFRGRQSEHDFLGYHQARPTLEEARQAADSGRSATGHVVVGYAKVRVEALQVIDIEPKAPEESEDDEVPGELVP